MRFPKCPGRPDNDSSTDMLPRRHVKHKLQIAASMQALTLVLVFPVPQGAHWLIRKQVHSGDRPLHPLQ